MKSKPRTDLITAKHRAIYIYYTLALRAEGKKAVLFPKMYFYAKVSRPFHMSVNAVGRIISKMQHQHYEPSEIEIQEFKDSITEMADVL